MPERRRGDDMTRAMMLGALVVIGAISSAVLAVKGQTQAPQVVQRLDLNVRDILYILTGGGGNTLALMRDDGVVLIDTKLPGWGRPLLETIQSVTDQLSLLDGLDRIDLYYFGRGHTDGDLVVVFPEKRLVHLGDLFPSKAAPF